VTGVNAAHVAVVPLPASEPPASKPVLPSGLVAFVRCELLDIIEQPYRIPTSAPPSTVVIAHAVRIIVVFPPAELREGPLLHGTRLRVCELFR
jgi:hypothetical protein